MNIKPLHDYIAIERNAESQKTGVLIPSLPSNRGIVVAVGPRVKEVIVGNVIQFNRYAGYMIQSDGLNVTLIHELDVSCIYSKDILND